MRPKRLIRGEKEQIETELLIAKWIWGLDLKPKQKRDKERENKSDSGNTRG